MEKEGSPRLRLGGIFLAEGGGPRIPGMTPDLAPVFERLEHWLAQHAPQIHAELEEGASDADLDALELATGHKLPAAYRALYRRHMYWGQTFPLDHVPLGHVLHEWLVWQELEAEFQETQGHASHPTGAITPQYINLGWIPLLKDWGGNSVGVDLRPGPGGVSGQVITFGRDENAKYVLAGSLEDFLTEYLRRLEAGRVTIYFPDEPPGATEHLSLHDASGEPVETYMMLADLFPGFGASPRQ